MSTEQGFSRAHIVRPASCAWSDAWSGAAASWFVVHNSMWLSWICLREPQKIRNIHFIDSQVMVDFSLGI